MARVLSWLGLTVSSDQWKKLETFANWVKLEAIGAGGVGPREAERIWSRHVADALTFAHGWRDANPPPRLLDVGAGVGLPGIPLAIVWPCTKVTLLDRAQRRIDLSLRAVRTLGLENVEVRQGDVLSEKGAWEAAVFRAVFSPKRALKVADRLLGSKGIAVIGLRGDDVLHPPGREPTMNRAVYVVEIPPEMLDAPASLLIMGPSES